MGLGPGRTRVRVRPYLRDQEGQPGLSDDLAPPGLRPFVLTSGRVAVSDLYIGLETQVTARGDGAHGDGAHGDGAYGDGMALDAGLTPEMRAIVALCSESLSIAEISARLQLHLGVARILVGDLYAAGYLDVQSLDAASVHDPELILRVIRGLREIS